MVQNCAGQDVATSSMTYKEKPLLSARGLLWPIVTIFFISALIVIYILSDEDEVADAPVNEPVIVEEAPPTEVPSAAVETATLPSFDIVRLSPSGAGVVAGRAAAGNEVILFADGEEIARTIADSRGEWVLILENPLPPGPTEFSLTATLKDGSSVESNDIVFVVVPDMEQAGQGEGVLAVLSPKDGKGVSRALQIPANGLSQDLVNDLRLEAIDFDENGIAVASGRAPFNQELRVYLDNRFVSSVASDDQGRWRVELGPLSGQSEKTLIRLDQVVGDGQVILRVEQSFNSITGAPEGNVERAVEIQPGNNLWAIARKIYGSGWRYAFIFKANANQIRDPDLIYPGQIFTLPPADGDITVNDGETDSQP